MGEGDCFGGTRRHKCWRAAGNGERGGRVRHVPAKVPRANLPIGLPTMGEARLTNQLGAGERRRKTCGGEGSIRRLSG
jgi:hypothetical protein